MYRTGPVSKWTPLPYWTPVLYWSSIAIVFMIANPVILTPRYISFSYDAITARGQVTSLDVIFYEKARFGIFCLKWFGIITLTKSVVT